jgi:hypothetical protein
VEQECAEPLNVMEEFEKKRVLAGVIAVPEPVEDVIVQNLMEALEQLRADLDKVELWTAALRCFQEPVPDYQPGDKYILPQATRRESQRQI